MDQLTLLPARSICGLTSLAAVNVIALCHGVVNLGILGSISSVQPVVMAGVTVYPWQQILLGLHVLLGFPFILAGLAASLYRLTDLMNAYFLYICVTAGFVLMYLASFVQQGGFCESSVLQRSAEGRMTCYLTSVIMSSVLLLPILFAMGVMYIVWSAVQLCREPIPELQLYRQKLENQEMPEPFQQSRAVPMSAMQGPVYSQMSAPTAQPASTPFVPQPVRSVAAPSQASRMAFPAQTLPPRPATTTFTPASGPFFTTVPGSRPAQSMPFNQGVPTYGTSQMMNSGVMRR